MSLRFTSHVLERMEERGIAQAWIEMALAAPDATEPDPRGGGLVRSWRAIPEAGGRVLRVVHRQEGSNIVVVTAFLDRGFRTP